MYFLVRSWERVSSRTAKVLFAAHRASSKPYCNFWTLQNSFASRSEDISGSRVASTPTSVVSGITRRGNDGEERQPGVGSSTCTVMQEVGGEATQIWLAEPINARIFRFFFLRVTLTWCINRDHSVLVGVEDVYQVTGRQIHHEATASDERSFFKKIGALENLKE